MAAPSWGESRDNSYGGSQYAAGSAPQSWPGDRAGSGPVVMDTERPLGELFSDMTRSLQALVRGEVELAKGEISEQVSKAAKAGAMLAAAAVIGFLALLLLAFAAAWGLAEAIPAGLAFLAIGLVFAAAAAVFLTVGKQRISTVKPVPQQTLQTLREDVDATKNAFVRGARD